MIFQEQADVYSSVYSSAWHLLAHGSLFNNTVG